MTAAIDLLFLPRQWGQSIRSFLTTLLLSAMELFLHPTLKLGVRVGNFVTVIMYSIFSVLCTSHEMTWTRFPSANASSTSREKDIANGEEEGGDDDTSMTCYSSDISPEPTGQHDPRHRTFHKVGSASLVLVSQLIIQFGLCFAILVNMFFYTIFFVVFLVPEWIWNHFRSRDDAPSHILPFGLLDVGTRIKIGDNDDDVSELELCLDGVEEGLYAGEMQREGKGMLAERVGGVDVVVDQLQPSIEEEIVRRRTRKLEGTGF